MVANSILSELYPRGAVFFGPACECGSRRTERIEGTSVRLCHTCGARGVVRVRFDKDRRYSVYLEPLQEKR